MQVIYCNYVLISRWNYVYFGFDESKTNIKLQKALFIKQSYYKIKKLGKIYNKIFFTVY